MSEFPRFSELPVAAGLPPRSGWQVWGPDDDLGSINHLTAERVVTAARLVRKGSLFPLDWTRTLPDPPIHGRARLVHTVLDNPTGTDDKYDDFYPQAGSQWDALGHVKHPEHGYYNGHTRADLTDTPDARLGIGSVARHGVAGRFVLIDLPRHFAQDAVPYDAASSVAITPDHLEAALARQGTDLPPGSILLIRFGWIEWYEAQSQDVRSELPTYDFPSPGLSPTEDMARWLWDHQVAAAAGDNPALERTPAAGFDDEAAFLHFRLIPLLGLSVGEMWCLDALAADCADDGVYEGLLTSAPFNTWGGSGSPANAVAIK